MNFKASLRITYSKAHAQKKHVFGQGANAYVNTPCFQTVNAILDFLPKNKNFIVRLCSQHLEGTSPKMWKKITSVFFVATSEAYELTG